MRKNKIERPEKYWRIHKIKFFFVKIATTVEGFKWDTDYSSVFDLYAGLGVTYATLFIICVTAVVWMICAI